VGKEELSFHKAEVASTGKNVGGSVTICGCIVIIGVASILNLETHFP